MSKIAALRDTLVALLQEHERDGTIPTNARFLFYELVQRGEISKERKPRTDGNRLRHGNIRRCSMSAPGPLCSRNQTSLNATSTGPQR